MPESSRIKARPLQWMCEPENRRIAVYALERGGKWADITNALFKERAVKVSPLQLNAFANRNKGATSAAEWLKAFLTSESFLSPEQQLYTPTAKIRNPKKQKDTIRPKTSQKNNGGASTPQEKPTITPKPHDSKLNAAQKRANMEIAKQRGKSKVISMLLRYGKQFAENSEIRGRAEKILHAVRYGDHVWERHVNVAYADMLIVSTEEGGKRTAIGKGANIDVYVSVSSNGGRPGLSTEGAENFGLVYQLKELIEGNGERDTDWKNELKVDGLERLDLYVVMQGAKQLVVKQILR